MKILFITSSSRTPDNLHPFQKSLLHALESLGIRGPRINLVNNPSFEVKRKRGVIPFMKDKLSYLSAILKEIESLIREEGVEIIHSFGTYLAGLSACLARSLLEVQYVVSVDGGSHIHDKIPRARNLTKAILTSAARITSPSKALASEISEFFGINPDKITVIPPIIELGKERLSENEAGEKVREKHKIPEDSPLILSSGTFWYSQGLHLLLLGSKKVLERFPHFKFLIIGDGPLYHEYLAMIHRLNLQESVILVKGASSEELSCYYAACDLFVYVPVYEDFAIPLLRAMAFSKPIIATRTGSIPEIISEGKNGVLIDPYDIPALTESIIKLVQDEELRKKLSLEARRTAENFNPKNAAKSMIKVYESILAERWW